MTSHPWNPSTAKDVSNITSSSDPTSVSGLIAPALPSEMQLTGLALFASIARGSAHGTVSPNVLAGLAKRAEALITQFVDDRPPPFWVLKDVYQLADASRASFSADLGVGFTDLLMTQLGYVYRANGRALAAKGKVPDFIYDGPPTSGTGVVIVEAKGQVGPRASKKAVQKRAKTAYANQVAPYIGVSWLGGVVLHGYAVAFGSQPGKSTSCIHIEESSAKPASASDDPPAPKPRTSTLPLRSRVILANYRSIFALIGIEEIVRAIDAALGGFPNEVRISSDYAGRFRSARTLSRSIIDLNTGDQIVLGIHQEIAEAFLSILSQLPQRGDAPIEMPTVEQFGLSEGEIVLFPDGLYAGVQRRGTVLAEVHQRLSPRNSAELLLQTITVKPVERPVRAYVRLTTD